MGEAFQTVKKRYVKRAIFTSCIAGSFCALTLVGVLLFTFKLCGVGFFWALYLPVALGAFLLAGGITFLLLRPNDLKIAKKLDSDYALGQKIQTMVECKDREGELYSVQREDALEKLSAIKPKKHSPLFFINYAAVSLLVCAVFFTGVFVPAKVAAEPDDTFEITDWQERALTQLIKEVQDSSLSPSLKGAEVTSLEGLLVVLRGEHTTTSMKAAVTAAMNLSVQLAAAENSYDELSAAFSAEENLKKFGDTLLKSAKCYGAKRDITSMQYVEGRREQIGATVLETMQEAPEDLNTAVSETNNLTGVPTIRAYANSITAVLEKAEDWTEDDALYHAFAVYAQTLDSIASSEGYPLTLKRENVFLAGEAFVRDSSLILSDQIYAEMTCEYVRRKLGSIFSVPIIDSTEPLPSDPNEGEENKDHQGGGGRDEIEFGSDDIIYDTRNGEYTQYGKVITAYYAEVQKILQNSETLSEEMKEKIQDYFNVLYRGYDE